MNKTAVALVLAKKTTEELEGFMEQVQHKITISATKQDLYKALLQKKWLEDELSARGKFNDLLKQDLVYHVILNGVKYLLDLKTEDALYLKHIQDKGINEKMEMMINGEWMEFDTDDILSNNNK